MKKLLLIVYLLFLSCDSSELFGVHELDDTTLDYYDYVSRGWQAIFDEDYELATSDFNQATLLDTVENKNSAYVGLGWTSTFSANDFLKSSECFSSDDIECVDVVNNLRLNASEYFDLVAIKNGMHNQKGYLIDTNNQFSNNFPLKNIMNQIISHYN